MTVVVVIEGTEDDDKGIIGSIFGNKKKKNINFVAIDLLTLNSRLIHSLDQ
jgi:hypothetical protein